MRRYRGWNPWLRRIGSSSQSYSQSTMLAPRIADLSDASTRISQSTEYISQTHSSIKIMNAFNELYQYPHSLFEDVLSLPQESLQFVDRIIPRSDEKHIRNFVIGDLINLYKLKKFDTFVRAFNMLKSWKTFPNFLLNGESYHDLNKYIENGRFKNDKSQILIYKFLITYSMAIGQNLLSASLILDNKSQINLDDDIDTKNVLLLLSSVHPSNNSDINYFTSLRILQQYPNLKLTNKECNDMLDNLLNDASGRKLYPSFANKLYDILSGNDTRKSRATFSPDLRYRLIDWNLQFGNIERAYQLWLDTEKTSCDSINTKVTSRLLESLNSCDTSSASTYVHQIVFNELKEEFHHLPHIEGTLIRIFGKSANDEYSSTNFDTLIRSMNPPTSRDSLQSLFEAFAFRGDVKNTERILSILFEQGNKQLNAVEFDIIIKKLLAENHFEQAIEMTLRQKGLDNIKYACLSLIKFALTKRSEQHESEFEHHYNKIMNASLIAFSRITNSNIESEKTDIFGKLTMIFFDHILEEHGARKARSFYSLIERGHGIDFQDMHNYFTNKPSLGLREDSGFKIPIKFSRFASFLHLDKGQRIPAILKILRYSFTDRILVNWCVKEMSDCGMTLPEIIRLVRFVYNEESLSIFKDLEGDIEEQKGASGEEAL
ncbi:hypothetical protein CLIB1423_03S01464 [[Candida] railenensis]|uniref:Uncharacterized protein n=1 Tax=[Candida] railenensis TaxID=45579 RepID=A0A9P0QMM3_9ASCO|nr:hypothetical protein CLIB1423_03S01464 [[Candida] railenensis]